VRKKKKLAIILLLIGVAAILIHWYSQQRASNRQDILRVSGNIEITDAEVSFKISGRVEERVVSEGEMVKKGQLVARLEDVELAQEAALRRAEVKAAQAALAELEAGSRREEIARAAASVQKAQARLEELRSGSRPQEVAAANAAVYSAKADAVRLKADYERLSALFRKNAVSTREYDAARSAYEMAEARLKEAEEESNLIKEGPRKEEIAQAGAALKEATQQFELVKKGPREETIEQARARLEQTKEALGLAVTRLGYATLFSPLSGVVLSENIEAGEYVAPGTPVVTVGDLANVWLRAYINETDLGRVKVGQQVLVTTDTYPGKEYEGRVSFIASQAEFTPKNVQTEKERVKLVYRVKVDIPNPAMELKPGMPADADILVGQSR